MKLSIQESLEVFGFETLTDLQEKRIKDVYHELAKKYHPDKGGNAGDFIRLREAYAVLKAAIINPAYQNGGWEKVREAQANGSSGPESFNRTQDSDSLQEQLNKYKQAYEQMLKQIKDYEQIINNQILVINRTTSSVNGKIDFFNQQLDNLKIALDKSLESLERKYKYKWWELVVPAKKLDKNQYITYYNQLIGEYNSEYRKINDKFQNDLLNTYQMSFNLFIDMLKQT